jgi:hypothetical protein
MFARIVTAGVLMCAMVGCAKKTPKVAQNTDDTAPPPQVQVQQPEPKPKAGPKSEKPVAGNTGEKPNWLNDPRLKKEGQLPTEAPKKPDWGTAAVPGVPLGAGGAAPGKADGKQPPGKLDAKPPQPAPMPTTPAAGGKAVTKNDMNDVWIFMENYSLASGKMPGPDEVYAALIKADSPAAALVKDGSIALSGARSREGIWAFEKNAPTNGGWIASQNGPEQVTAAEFARRAKER